MRIFVTGGTGLVGTRLTRRVLARGDKPVVLTRRFAHARQALGTEVELVEGDPMQPGDWMNKVDDCDAVVHLAGENVAQRWTAEARGRWELIGRGLGIHWPELDEDLSVAGLLGVPD